MDNGRPVDTRIENIKDLETTVTGCANNNRAANIFPYRESFGRLMCLMIGISPDHAFGTRKLAHFWENPTLIYGNAVKRVLRHIKGTSNLGHCFPGRD